MRPGPGTPPDEAARNQRGRLFGALVASVAERGYAATRLTDLVELSGVSRNSFYSHFADKEACFVAAVEELLTIASGAVETPADDWSQLVREAAGNFSRMIVAQPAAARMCLLEVYVVGPEGLRPVELATARFEAHALKVAQLAPAQEGMAAEMVAAGLGAVLQLTRNLLLQDRIEALPETVNRFVDVALAYRPPSEPLRLAVRLPSPAPEPLAPDHEARALRALAAVAAEKGYANTTVNDVVKRASMSSTTFYSYFADKEDALLAAIDSAGAEMVATIMPAFRRSPDWQQGVRAAIGAFFNFLASRPALTRLVLTEVNAAGPRAIERRRQALQPLEMVLAEGRARAVAVSRITIEAITAGISALAAKRIREQGPESLPGLAPICTYLTLMPFVGPDEACAAANGDGRGRGSRAAGPGDRFLVPKVLAILGNRRATIEQISSELNAPADEVHKTIDELRRGGLTIVTEEGDGGSGPIYRSEKYWLEPHEWEQMSLAERQQTSRQVDRLISGDVDLALETGTFDARVDRHMSRVPLLLDERGWRELGSIHRKAFLASLEVRAKAMERLKESGATPIDGRSVQLMFEVPPSVIEGQGMGDPGMHDPLADDSEGDAS